MSRFIKKNSLVITTVITLACVGGIFYWILPAKAEPLDTYHSSWHEIRATATEDGDDFATVLPLATNKGDFANKPSGAFRISSRPTFGRAEGFSPGSRWMFAFCGQHEADDTFSFNLVGWAKTNGMAQIICEGNGVLGTQDVVIEPNGDTDPNMFWADTIALDEETKWPGSFNDANGVRVFNSGDNEVAILVVDTTGLEWIQFITYDVAGGAEAASIGVYGRRY